MPDGDYLWRVNDHGKTRREIARHSRCRRRGLRRVRARHGGDGTVRQADSFHAAARSAVASSARICESCCFWSSASARCRARTSTDLVQLMTMSAVDFLDRWFETDVLKATMSASGIIGTFLGVRSPGTAYVLLHHYMGEIDGAFRSWGLPRGGTGNISNAIAAAAREAGADIRSETRGCRHPRARQHGARRHPREWRRAARLDRGVERRSARHLSPICGSRGSPGRISRRREPLQISGLVRQGQPGARCAARFHVPAWSGGALARRDLNLAEHRLHGACLRRREVRPILTAAVHGHRHTVTHRSQCRPAGKARHVVLRAVRAVSPARGLVG